VVPRFVNSAPTATSRSPPTSKVDFEEVTVSVPPFAIARFSQTTDELIVTSAAAGITTLVPEPASGNTVVQSPDPEAVSIG